MKPLYCVGVAAILLSLASAAQASPVTGTYDVGDGTDGNTAFPGGVTGPWNVTATNSSFGYVLFHPVELFTLSDMTSLSVSFLVNGGDVGGSGGGSPRLRIQLNGGSSISVYLGNSPGYDDSPATLQGYSNFNVIGNNDTGRYDTSAFAGGSPFSNYSSAVALLGGMHVTRLGIVEDTFGGLGNRDITVSSIDAAAVPLPAAVLPGMALLAGLGVVRKIRSRISKQI